MVTFPTLRASLPRIAIGLSVALASCDGSSPDSKLELETSLYALVETIDGVAFYPPLGPEPVFAGAFDSTLLGGLTVELEATDSEGADHLISTFDASSTPALLRMDRHEVYFVNLTAANYFTDPSLAYRFVVNYEGREIGRSDLSERIFAVLAERPGFTIGFKLRVEVRPAPSATSLDPASASAGSPELTLAVHGSGFLHDSTVYLGGTALATTFVSSGELTAVVPSSLLTIAGEQPVTVVTAAPGGGTSEALTFTVAPAGCVEGSVAFSSIAEVQSFVVPESCGMLTVKLWGAGGGSGCYSGGAGGFVRARIEATPGETLSVYVGQRGSAVSYHDSFYRCGGDGGGRSELRRADGTTLVVAGGGGGNGSLSSGGGGGGLSGQAGFGYGPHGINSGGGGSQSGGGNGGSSNINWAQWGGFLYGGNNGWNQGRTLGWPNGGGGGAGGGGGGDGWYGGGGGGEGWCGSSCSQAGGGGSSYISGPGVLTNRPGEGTFGASSTSLAAEATSDPDYVAGAGASASDGRVVIHWGPDRNPDALSLAALEEQPQGVSLTSSALALTGFDGPITVSASGDGAPEVSVNGGPFASSVDGVFAPASLVVRMTTPLAGCAASNVTLTAGDRSTTWSVRTGGCQTSCLGHFDAGATADGNYPVDPDGPGGNAPFDVYCLMSQDGGGWTRLSNTTFSSGPTVNGNGQIAGTVYNNGTCNTHYWWTISGVIIPHTTYRAILTRGGTVLQCSYLTGFYETSYWNGSGWSSNPSTCTWSQPWAYCVNCTGTGGLPQVFRYFGNAQSSYTYTTACSAEAGGYTWEIFVR